MSAAHQTDPEQTDAFQADAFGGERASDSPPVGRERRSRDRMPDVDWLTGISSRAAFARQVGQADKDRDQFAVAIIGLRHIDEINRHLGFNAGDDLLRIVGRALSDRVGVGTTVARLGGARFGMMTVDLATEDVGDWLEPMTAGVNNAIAGWIFEQIDFNGECLIEPKLMVGAAGGYSGRVWADAAIALDVCENQPDVGQNGGSVIVHDPNDPRFAAIDARESLNGAVLAAIDHDMVRWTGQQVERCQNPNPNRPWLKIMALDPGNNSSPVDTHQLQPSIGSRLERLALERAATMLTAGGGQMRVTVPLCWLLRNSRGVEAWLAPVVADNRVPSSRFVFEVQEMDLADTSGRAASAAREIVELGSELVLAGCSGGLGTVTALAAVPVRYLRPDETLLRRAETGDRSADRVLEALVGMASDIGCDVIFAEYRPTFGRPGATVGFHELEPVVLEESCL